MSTFEVLKYGEVDITNATALVPLPMDIIERFWIIMHQGEQVPLLLHHAMCHSIAAWAKTGLTLQEREYTRSIFLRALREVDPQ